VATARAVGHRSQLVLARQRVRRQRRQGQQVGPLAWFAVQGVIDQQVVRAVWADGGCAVTGCWRSGPGCWSTWAPSSAATIPRPVPRQAPGPPVAVLLTLIRACDLATMMEVDLGTGSQNT
jgi:hypothetical protein